MGTDRQPGAITGINVTPLVDITLVLLIIFMVTAKLIVRHDTLGVELPRATGGHEEPEVFGVVLSARGDIAVNGAHALSDESLRSLARSALAQHPDLRAVIEADGSVPHRRVIRVLNSASSKIP